MNDNEDGLSDYHLVYNIPAAEFKYYENFMPQDVADYYFETFMQLPFEQGRVTNGVEKRKTCFFSELTSNYRYSGKDNPPLPFTPELMELKRGVEQITKCQYNSCLVNLYENGKHVIGFHSDSESSLKKLSTIASISLGAERWFDVRAKETAPNPNLEFSIRTKHGSMMTMGGYMQSYYKHQIRQEAAVKTPRINLTFRLSV